MESENIQLHGKDIEEICYADTELTQEVNNDFVETIYLTSKECQALETWGQVIIDRNDTKYLLDGNGIRELLTELDIPNISNDTSSHEIRIQDSFLTSNIINQDENVQEVSTIPQNGSIQINQDENVQEVSTIPQNGSIQIEDPKRKGNFMGCKNIIEQEGDNLEFVSICASTSNFIEPSESILSSNSLNGILENKTESEILVDKSVLISEPENNASASIIIQSNLKRKYVDNDDNDDNAKSDTDNIPEKNKEKLQRFYLGNTNHGKKLFGKIIDYRPSKGTKITKEQLESVENVIKNKLSQLEFLKHENDKMADTEPSSSQTLNLNSEEKMAVNTQTINTSDNNSKTLKHVNNKKGKIKNHNLFQFARKDLQKPERNTEESEQLADVKAMITLLIPMSTDIPIMDRNLLIFKKVNLKSHPASKEYMFTGRVVGSDNTGWNFCLVPELALQINEKTEESKKFLIIRISSEEGSDGKLQNVITIENKDDIILDLVNAESKTNNELSLNEEISKATEIKKLNGRKYFECTYCRHYFYGLIHFKRHIKIHRTTSSDNTLQCCHCTCTFIHESTLTRHIVEAHRNTATYSV